MTEVTVAWTEIATMVAGVDQGRAPIELAIDHSLDLRLVGCVPEEPAAKADWLAAQIVLSRNVNIGDGGRPV
jgi:hypothetical protein